MQYEFQFAFSTSHAVSIHKFSVAILIKRCYRRFLFEIFATFLVSHVNQIVFCINNVPFARQRHMFCSNAVMSRCFDPTYLSGRFSVTNRIFATLASIYSLYFRFIAVCSRMRQQNISFSFRLSFPLFFPSRVVILKNVRMSRITLHCSYIPHYEIQSFACSSISCTPV